jgi:Cd2+/Zn2+-exporting ATPase
MKTIELKIPNLQCMGCVNATNNSLTKLVGVISVNTNLSSKTVTVKYNENTITVNQITKTLVSIGYPVEK